MIRFNCDYDEGAHEKIMEVLLATNLEQTPGYGMDAYTTNAKESIRGICRAHDADVHFLIGGTQANLTVISAALRPHQGVLAAETAHINVHETGAVEACGHKILTLPSMDGKITAEQVEEAYFAHMEDESFEHMVQPKLVYISNPTELGTIYHKEELEKLANVCQRCGLLLYMDGARLGYGLAAADNDLSFPDIAELCDAFYIGGTKIGALFGEAVVLVNPALKEDFRYLVKQKGGMLAKGRLLGLQFLTLFGKGKDGKTLYMEASEHAIEMADLLRAGIEKAGYPYFVENGTNQIFPILPVALLDQLKTSYSFTYQQRIDAAHCVVRFCTSWATKRQDVEALIRDLQP